LLAYSQTMWATIQSEKQNQALDTFLYIIIIIIIIIKCIYLLQPSHIRHENIFL
jgi:hypothetical protein